MWFIRRAISQTFAVPTLMYLLRYFLSTNQEAHNKIDYNSYR
uniref:Uncharacterized protein n=1 Tax=Setaria italica TaxID=4555 RepID=K3XTJ8_SETIT